MKLVEKSLVPGISALTLNSIAEESIRSQGAFPSFLNYGASKKDQGFPGAICVSINDEIVHGIPAKDKILKEGDIVSLDLGACYKGIHTDMSFSKIIGNTSNSKDKKMIETAKEVLMIAIKNANVGTFTGDIGYEIENYVNIHGFSVIKALVGHGIGSEVHQDPQVPNFGQKGTGYRLETDIAIAIEPMISAGSSDVKTEADGWTVRTADGAKAAHFEKTVLITNDGAEIIT